MKKLHDFMEFPLIKLAKKLKAEKTQLALRQEEAFPLIKLAKKLKDGASSPQTASYRFH